MRLLLCGIWLRQLLIIYSRGVGRGRCVGWGLGVGVAVAPGVAVALGLGVPVGVGVDVALGVAVGLAVGVGEGVVQPSEVKCSFSVRKPTPSTYCNPTAHTSQAVIAAVPRSLPVTLGLGNTPQLLPFQRPIKAKPPPSPTAHAPPGDTAATPYAALSGSTPKPWTWLQLFPSQCSINVVVMNVDGFRDLPTVQTSFALVSDTALRKLSPWGLGLDTMLHVEPFQCSTSVENPEAALPQYPTAQTSFGLSATTL